MNVAFKFISNACHLDIDFLKLPRHEKYPEKKKHITKESFQNFINKAWSSEPKFVLDCLFLFITGLRINNAKEIKLLNFDGQALENFQTSKRGEIKNVYLTSQFLGQAKRMNWKEISLSQSQLNKKLKKFTEVFGFPVSCHAFRHGNTTHQFLIEIKKKIKQRSGWKTTRAMETYIHRDSQIDKEMIKYINENFKFIIEK